MGGGCLGLSLALTLCTGASPQPSDAPSTSLHAPALVIGLAGGMVRHDNPVHGVVQFAERLRRDFPEGVYVEVFENRRWQQAREEIERRLAVSRDGKPSAEEKQNARVIIYGHSWGASETLHLAAELGKEGIPVLLTIQVDSVNKPGEDGSVVPANVAEAINFYQQDGWLHGRTEIRAADPARTRILGNIKRGYKTGACPGYPWYNRWFTVPHCAIEIDPQIWEQAEALIRARLEPSAPAEPPQPKRQVRAAGAAIDASHPPD